MLGLGVIFFRVEKRVGVELLIVFRKLVKVGDKLFSILFIFIVEFINVNENCFYYKYLNIIFNLIFK